MAPDWIPTWALFLTAAFFAGVAVLGYVWCVRSDRKKASKAVSDIKAALREELDARDVQIRSIKETFENLPQTPLKNGHTYAELPAGTSIVSHADGSYSLSLPIRMSASSGTPSVGISAFAEAPSASLSRGSSDD